MPDRKHDPEKFRRSLICAMAHLRNAFANLPDDGDPCRDDADTALTNTYERLARLLDQSRICHPSK